MQGSVSGVTPSGPVDGAGKWAPATGGAYGGSALGAGAHGSPATKPGASNCASKSCCFADTCPTVVMPR
jgi:hypothetical protein